MSLSNILNNEPDLDKSTNNDTNTTQVQTTAPTATTKDQAKLNFLRLLNNNFDKLAQKDSLQLLQQDWNFINLQEFELINEWNQQSKDSNYSIGGNSDLLNFLNAEWNNYKDYKLHRNNLINFNKKSTSTNTDITTTKKKKKKNHLHLDWIQNNIKSEHIENGELVMPLGNEMDDTDIHMVNDRNDNDEIEDDDDDDDDADEDAEDDDDLDLELDEIEEINDDDDDDAEFTIGYVKKTKKPSTLENQTPVTLDSDKSRIISEIQKQVKKSKLFKVKKRRFTNIYITEYKNNETKNNNNNTEITPTPINLNQSCMVKITLKQNHVKKLKKMFNDEKKLELSLTEQQNIENGITPNGSPSKKRRKIGMDNENDINNLGSNNTNTADNNQQLHNNNTTNNKTNNNTANNNENDSTNNNISRRPTHELPTYGLKLNVKEARAVKRHYDNTYITIWKDLARRDSNRMLRLYQQIQSVRAINFKKTSSLCAREAKKWQYRNFKQVKDMQTRARRGMREMLNFWKRNEREERESKRKYEKVAIEQAKKEEEERESKRQAKKLNFLLTQTELYSHFIGRKIKTNEIEGNNNAEIANNDIDLEKTNATKNEFNEIDFDNENDDQLRLKAAENASNVLAKTRAQAQAFDKQKNIEEGADDDDDELNFQNPTSLGDITVEQPNLLACTLKEYQLKGLTWLANLYDQGINGILADEMGLGKTVQSISVLAHLAERYNIWGPFLVVTPASTLHNWVNEITKFVPEFKVLPYWGNGNDRKTLRKFWDRKNLRYGKDSPFHVMITSYQMVVTDFNYLQKMRWQYMILDEAQAIKSSQSSRWRNLLNFHCRNRLLLTGTPIQNNMQELWALLHFIMPSLFDSHDEFSEWFSKDIESHAEGNGQLNQEQLRRLHMILKPFMLRRIKKNVQSELGDKIEIDVLCDLTQRQRKLYQILRSQLSSDYDAIEHIAGADAQTGDTNLLNAVMQFRKVCNHPDLFERADVDSPFSFVNFGKTSTISKNAYNSLGSTNTNNNSSVSVNNIPNNSLNTAAVSNYANLEDVVYSTYNPISYYLPRLIYDELLLPNYNDSQTVFNKYVTHIMDIYHPANNKELTEILSRLTGLPSDKFSKIHHELLINRIINFNENDCNKNPNFNRNLLIEDKLDHLNLLSKQSTSGVIETLMNIKANYYDEHYMNSLNRSARYAAVATPINIQVLGSSNFSNKIQSELFDPVVSQAFSEIPPIIEYKMHYKKHIPVEAFPKAGLFPSSINKNFSSSISMPSMNRFITESAKLKKLDEMLPILKQQDHRVLIYFQMTKMMDLMEEYLTYRQYNHIRLDGSSKLEDRRDLVHDWQTKPEIFVFLLSTRAGGLGINLTAADTVIFYDSDWNPTIDSQAMDRAHRLGQTKQVTVYRLLARNTIEERMRDRAKQKEQVQQVVMEGKTQDHNVRTLEANDNINAKERATIV